jgi:UDP:flavonoid glycosyltransferase YjiC (YdhE family)
MKFALSSYGTRGDVEPCAAVGLELLRRGHEVCVAAPPDLMAFVESAGLAAVANGPDTREIPEFFRTTWTIRHPIEPLREGMQHVNQVWAEISARLRSMADGADVLVTGHSYQEAAANVAEYYDIPLVAWHCVPLRPNGHLIPVVPSRLIHPTMTVFDWVQWRWTKTADDGQRRELGLPKATGPASRRMAERQSLEIQAYDELCFPGLAAEWDGRRPFVGALTLESPTDADDEVASWIAAGTPPIYFGFGSMPIHSFTDTVTMIGHACRELGERALICSGASDFSRVPDFDHVKIVSTVRHAAVFARCRAVVHHGGSGTTAAGLRAGIPTLILWIGFDQPIWAAVVKRLKVGRARRFSTEALESLVTDLRRILAPEYVTRAREIAARMIPAAVSVKIAADFVESAADCRSGASH